MRNWIRLWGILLVVIGSSPPDLLAQYAPQPRRPLPRVDTAPNPRQQRAARERMVATVGQEARAFVEAYGEDAVAALSACKRGAALDLVKFHNSGGLTALPRPRELLRVIAMLNHGGDVATWAIAHGKELADDDKFDAFVLDPLSYALELKNLEEGARRIKQGRALLSRELPQPQGWGSLPMSEQQSFAMGAGLTLVIVAVIWLCRKRSIA